MSILPTPRPWPVPMWPEFWPWAAWKLSGSPLPQPPEAKRLAARYHRQTGRWGVPKWAWLRLSYMKARPRIPVPQTPTLPAPFNGRGVFLLEPGGGTEDVAAWKRAGGTYLLLNVRHIGDRNWSLHRHRAQTVGLEVVPWCRVTNEREAVELERLADQWGSRAVAHNLEGEALTTLTPATLGRATDTFPNRVRAAVTEPWMQNGAGWHELGRRGWVAMPEAFLNASPLWQPAVLCEHAKLEGMPLAVPAFGWGKWSDAPTFVEPSTYLAAWRGPFAVYPGDGREHLYGEWSR